MSLRIVGSHVVVFDAGQHRLVRNGEVVIEADRITYAGRRRKVGPPGCTVLDATGRLTTPGFVNLHAHATLQAHALFSLDEGRRDFYGSSGMMYAPPQGRDRTLSPQEARIASEWAVAALLRRGTTTVLEMGASQGGLPELVETVGQLGIRAYLGLGFRSADYYLTSEGRFGYRWDEDAGQRGLRRAVDFIEKHDGMFNGRLRGVLVPRQVDTCSPDLLKTALQEAERLDVPVQLHAAQRLFEFHEMMRRTGKTPVGYLADLGVLRPRTLLGHCIFVTGHESTGTPGDEDLRLIAAAGASVVHCPMVFARIGVCLRTFARYRRCGINVAIGTDVPPLDMLAEMRLALYLCKVLEFDYAAATAWDMFNAATLGGAQALGRTDLGRLCPGAKADIVIWDLENLRVGPVADPIKSLVYMGTGEDAETVLVDGQIVVDKGVVAGCDERRLSQEAQELAERIWSHRWPDRWPPLS